MPCWLGLRGQSKIDVSEACSTEYNVDCSSSACSVTYSGGCVDNGTMYPPAYSSVLGAYSMVTAIFESSATCIGGGCQGRGADVSSPAELHFAEESFVVGSFTPKLLSLQMRVLHGAEPMVAIDDDELAADNADKVLDSYEWMESLSQCG